MKKFSDTNRPERPKTYQPRASAAPPWVTNHQDRSPERAQQCEQDPTCKRWSAHALRSVVYLLTFAVCASCATAPALAAHIVAWEFEATIVNIEDPDRLFGDVQLGDTVRGTFRYDLTTEPDNPSQLPSNARYTHPAVFAGLYVVIENPRTGGKLEYLPTFLAGDAYSVTVWDDPDLAGESEVLFSQWAIPPVPEVWPGALIEFSGANVLEDASLPTAFELNDWPLAVVYFAGSDIFSEGIEAQIYSLMPIILGDFDTDDDRDGADFLAWQRGESPYPLSTIDLADWQVNFGRVLNLPDSGSTVVPEPSTWFLLTTLLVALLTGSRAAALKACSPNGVASTNFLPPEATKRKGV